MDTDPLKYGRLCGEIKYMGIMIAAQKGDFRRGFIGIRTLPMKNCVLELVTEDMQLLADWIKQFGGNISFCCNYEESTVLAYLYEQGIDINVKCRSHGVYQGKELNYTLPESVQIRKLEE